MQVCIRYRAVPASNSFFFNAGMCLKNNSGMSNSISIVYPSGSESLLKIDYAIDMSDSLQTISCNVDCERYPLWLQLRSFNLLSVKDRGAYTLLFNEVNNSKNLDTSLFIDLVYTSIMKTERMKCA